MVLPVARILRLDGAVEPNNSFGLVDAGAMNASSLQPHSRD